MENELCTELDEKLGRVRRQVSGWKLAKLISLSALKGPFRDPDFAFNYPQMHFHDDEECPRATLNNKPLSTPLPTQLHISRKSCNPQPESNVHSEEVQLSRPQSEPQPLQEQLQFTQEDEGEVVPKDPSHDCKDQRNEGQASVADNVAEGHELAHAVGSGLSTHIRKRDLAHCNDLPEELPMHLFKKQKRTDKTSLEYGGHNGRAQALALPPPLNNFGLDPQEPEMIREDESLNKEGANFEPHNADLMSHNVSDVNMDESYIHEKNINNNDNDNDVSNDNESARVKAIQSMKNGQMDSEEEQKDGTQFDGNGFQEEYEQRHDGRHKPHNLKVRSKSRRRFKQRPEDSEYKADMGKYKRSLPSEDRTSSIIERRLRRQPRNVKQTRKVNEPEYSPCPYCRKQLDFATLQATRHLDTCYKKHELGESQERYLPHTEQANTLARTRLRYSDPSQSSPVFAKQESRLSHPD